MEHPTTIERRTLHSAATAIVLTAFLARFISLNQSYPFDFLWDQDQIVTLDAMLMQSGFLPDNVNHPGFGAYFLMVWIQRIARLIGATTVVTLADLDAALNPIFALAELTTFNRLISPFLVCGTILALWLAIEFLASPRPMLSILSLTAIGMQSSLAYQSAIIRTDLYSLFFWSVGFAALASTVRGGARSSLILLRSASITAGLCFGLSFLAKMQSIFHIAGAIIFCFLQKQDQSRDRLPLLPARFAGLLAAVTLAAFCFILTEAYAIEIPRGYQAYAREWGLAPLGAAMIAALAMLTILNIRSARPGGPRDNSPSTASLVALGALLALGLHFFAGPPPARAWELLLFDVKTSFLRSPLEGAYQEPEAWILLLRIEKWLHLLRWPFVLLLFHVLLRTFRLTRAHDTIAGFISSAGGPKQISEAEGGTYESGTKNIRKLAAAVAVGAVVLALSMTFGSRFILRDQIWPETLVVVLMLVTMPGLSGKAGSERHALRSAYPIAALLLVIATSAAQNAAISARIDANYNVYGWERDIWFKNVYSANQPRYGEIMKRHYRSTAMKESGLIPAERQADISRIVDFVFPTRRTNCSSIGVLAGDFPVFRKKPEWIISEYSPGWQGAIIADISSMPPGGWFLRPELTVDHSEYLDKFRGPATADTVIVMPRSDLEVMVFRPQTGGPQTSANMDAPHVILTSGIEMKKMTGTAVTIFTEFAAASLENDCFFAIRRRAL